MMTIPAPEWVRNAVFYQIFMDRFANGNPSNDPPGVVPWGSPPKLDNFFGGDLQGVLDHLPYLVDLGITALYLTPIFTARSNHKYDICDYLNIDPSFGTTQLFRKFVDEAHSRGIRVVLDAVFNHCGDCFWAFEDVKQRGSASQYQNWFYPTTFPIRQDYPNYQTCGGVASMPKLNVTNPRVQEYLLKVTTFWLQEFSIDGWRLDVPWKVNRDFWRIFREVVKQINPEAYIVGEIWRDPKPWLEGDTCDGIMNYPLRDYILDYCVRDTMDAEDFDYATSHLRDVCGSAAPYQMNLLGSHDTPRILTLCSHDIKRATLAITALFTAVGTPMVYYGDEIGLVGGNDPDCRGCMIWEEKAWNNQLLNTYRILIGARTNHPALHSENLEKLVVFNRIYAYRRYLDDDEVITIINPGEEAYCQKIPVSPNSIAHRKWRDIFTGRIVSYNKGCLEVNIIPSRTALVFVPEK